MSKTGFTVAFSGNAVADGTIDVRELAPALLSLAALFDEANRTLNQDRAAVRLQVKATAPGSFEISFELVQSLYEQTKGFLAGEDVTAALNLAALIVGGSATVGGLFALIRKLRGRVPERLQRLDGGVVRLQIDGETFDVPLALMRLYQDQMVRRAAEKALDPLTRPGIERVDFKVDGRVTETVVKSDLPLFTAPEAAEDVLVDQVQQRVFSIVSLAFKEDNKWRLSDGTGPAISVDISDDAFIGRVARGEARFAVNDLLVCDVRVRQVEREGKLRTEYTVKRVREHRQGAKQLMLDLLPPDGDASAAA